MHLEINRIKGRNREGDIEPLIFKSFNIVKYIEIIKVNFICFFVLIILWKFEANKFSVGFLVKAFLSYNIYMVIKKLV